MKRTRLIMLELIDRPILIAFTETNGRQGFCQLHLPKPRQSGFNSCLPANLLRERR
jgi:hypothetical protein